MNIGKNLKRLRQANSLTQAELANRTRLTKGFISQLERDQVSPSIGTLKDLLDVLGVSLTDFFKEDIENRPVFTPGDRITTSNSTLGCRIEILLPDTRSHKLEPSLVTINEGVAFPAYKPHKGEEFGIVLQGRINLKLANKVYEVNENDCFYIRSDSLLAISNIGTGEAKICWITILAP